MRREILLLCAAVVTSCAPVEEPPIERMAAIPLEDFEEVWNEAATALEDAPTVERREPLIPAPNGFKGALSNGAYLSASGDENDGLVWRVFIHARKDSQVPVLRETLASVMDVDPRVEGRNIVVSTTWHHAPS